MSVAFPNGQQPEIPSIIASFADGHPTTDQPNNGSFAGGAAFSFEQHNPTQLFGHKVDTQNQMQTQSSNHLMVEGNQTGFTSDYDMDIGNDDSNAHRDEDFDIDLDIGDGKYDDGDIDLELAATPMGIVEDDLQMEGVPAATEDDVMFDDTNTDVHNEDMVLGDGPSAQQQQQQQQQQAAIQQAAPSIFSVQETPAQPSLFDELVKEAEERRRSDAFVFQPPQPVQPEPSIPEPVVEELPQQEEPAKEPTPPAQSEAKSPTPRAQSPQTQQQGEKATTPPVVEVTSPKREQTPPSSEAVRISQAETVPVENTPEVRQGEWGNFNAVEYGQPAAPAPVAAEPAYYAAQEIPTSPFQPSEHGDTPQPSAHEYAPEPTHEETSQPTVQEHTESDYQPHDPSEHPIVIVYRDTEFSLFPPTNTGYKLPETFFLPNRSDLEVPLSKLVGNLRDVLGEEFSNNDELIINFTSLGLEFEEENNQLNHFSLSAMIDLFNQLHSQDGVTEVQPLYISLSSRLRYMSKLDQIRNHLAGGGGMFSWNRAPGTLDKVQSLLSEAREDEQPQAPKPEEAGREVEAYNANEQPEDDEDLELEEFEKEGFEEDTTVVNQSTEVETSNDQEEAVHVSHIDVPKSPSQETKPRVALTRDNTNLEKVSETQYSTDHHVTSGSFGLPADTPAEEPQEYQEHHDISSITGEHEELVDNNASRDEASFVTAESKPENARIRTLTQAGSYGVPISPSEAGSEQAAEDDINDKDDDEPLDFETDNNATFVEKQQLQVPSTAEQKDDTKSSTTLGGEEDDEAGTHEGTLDNEDNEAAAATEDDPNWNENEWAYVEGAEAGEDDQYEYEEEEVEQAGTTSASVEENDENQEPSPEGGDNEGVYAGLPTFETSGADNLEGDEAFDEFAYYPQQFSDYDNAVGEEEYEGLEDENYVELEQQETLSNTGASSTKRAREDDDEEEEGELEDDVKQSPSQASKRHRAL